MIHGYLKLFTHAYARIYTPKTHKHALMHLHSL